MSYETILTSIDDGVLTITLNRPDRLNAFTIAMQRELCDALERSDADDAVRSVIVTGAGRAFCAGADLAMGKDAFNYKARPKGAEPGHRDHGGVLALRIHRSLKPVIAAINGPAVGIGITMTLPMDVRLASTAARIGFVFVRRGIVPEAASSFFLPRIVGISRALEWTTTGRIFSAEEAKEGGLLRSVHAPEDLMPAATALAREVAEGAPVSVAMTRQMMWRSFAQDHPMEAHRLDSRAVLARGASRDAAEGVSSFLEKRRAAFPDKVSSDMPDFFAWRDEPPFE
jgi:enoyl-CoA hydratase/carnithine racemase